MRASLVLQRARGVLLERGWCQGTWRDSDGRVCASQAIWDTWRGRQCPYIAAQEYVHATHIAAQEYVHATTGCLSVSQWNDEPGRVLGDILTALDLATSAALSDEAGE